eukprot:6214614-Pleurochrysis_carterae.AAC.8
MDAWARSACAPALSRTHSEHVRRAPECGCRSLEICASVSSEARKRPSVAWHRRTRVLPFQPNTLTWRAETFYTMVPWRPFHCLHSTTHTLSLP